MADANRAIQLQLFLTGEKPTVKGLDNVNKASNRAASGVRKVGGAAGSTSRKMPPLINSMKGTSGAVINFNRVIQDSPYGLIGVANNIDPLIISFKELQQQTGSAGKAFKTLISSAFLGPLGFVTIASIASSIAIAFGPKIWNALFGKKNRDAVEAMQEKMKELNEEVRTLTKRSEDARIAWEHYLETGEKLTQEQLDFKELLTEQAQAQDALRRKTLEVADARERATELARAGSQVGWAMVRTIEAEQEGLENNALAIDRKVASMRNAIEGEAKYEEGVRATEQAQKDAADAERERRDGLVKLWAMQEATQKGWADWIQRASQMRRDYYEQEEALDQERAQRQQEALEHLNKEQEERSRLRDLEEDEQMAALARLQAAQAKWRESVAKSGAAYIQNAIIHKKSAEQIMKDLKKLIARQLIFFALQQALGFVTGTALFQDAATSKFGKVFGLNNIPQARSGVTNYPGGPLKVHKDELIWTPPGTTVLSQSASRQAMRDGGGTQQVAVYLNGDLANLVDAIEVLSDRNVRSGVGPSLGNR